MRVDQYSHTHICVQMDMVGTGVAGGHTHPDMLISIDDHE